MGFGSVSCWEPGRSPGVAGAGWHRAPPRGGGIYHPAAAAGSAPGLCSLSLAHRSSTTGFHGLHTTNKLTHVGVCPNTRVDSHTHGDLSMRPSSHVCAPQPRSRTNLTCVATLCTLARHPLAACVHTQEVTQICTHTQVCTHQCPDFTPATCEARIALPALGAVLAGACLAQLCSNPGAAPGCRWGLSSPPSPRMGT